MHDVSAIDRIFRQYVMKTRFFTKGWGQMSHLRRLLEFKQLAFSASGHAMLNPAIPPEVRLDHKATTPLFTRHQGSFESPLVALLPGILPSESHTAHFELVMPVHRSSSPARRLCILLGGTGEHYYSRRRSMLAVPLAKRGIASIILENPFYGLRKPKTQFRSSLHYLSDLFTMGLGVIAESALLFNWAERQLGMDQLGVQGFSLGGHMAALVGSALERPLVCVPCLSAATARDVFVDGGVMRSAVDWRALQSDYSPPLQHLLDSFAFISPPALLTRAQHHKRQQQHQDGAYDIEDAMRILLDEATNLTTTRPPRNCTSTSLPHAPHDAYIPHPSSAALIRHWCPARSPPLSGGHVSSYLFCHGLFVDEIALAFDRL